VTDAPPTASGPIGVVVVNYGSSGLLVDNLPSAAELGADARVVVVDNFSTAEELQTLTRLGHDRGWVVVPLPDNRGFGAASNAGVAAARAQGCVTFMLLNPDAQVAPEVLAELRAHSLRDPMAMISPSIRSSTGDEAFGGSTLSLRDGRIRGVRSARPRLPEAEPWLTGACLVVHEQLWDLLGGFDEGYFLYWEDVDLSHRALAVGGRLEVRPDLVVVHDEGGTHGERRGRGKSELYYRYNCRNRLVFAARNLPRRRLLRWVLATPRVSWEILLRGGRRQLVESPRPLLAAVRGSVEGLGVALGALLVRRRRAAGGQPVVPTPRRVLLVHAGAELYGSDRVFLESVVALVGRDRVVVVLPEDGPLAAAVRDVGAEVVRCPMPVLRKEALRPRGAVRLVRQAVAGLLPAIRLLRTAGRDGVYVSTLTIPSWIVLARLLRIPVVCHVHEAERSARPLLRRLLALPVSWASSVVVNSRFSLDVLTASAPAVRDRAAVVRNGIPGPDSVAPARAVLQGPVRLVYVGRLSPRKGPQVAVAALAELRRRGVPACLELVGSVFPGYEWFEAELRDTVDREGLGDVVSFAGFRPDVWPALAAADIVLVPSVVDEPFGNTAVEAVLAARPLVVSDTSGLREAAEGYLAARRVRPDRPHDWATAIAELVDGWAEVREQALGDAERAVARHAPETYRAELADRLHETWGRR
jgi:GT2 family glycosyltransferase/glycosyltransferase involved in cell wall biosynthesis